MGILRVLQEHLDMHIVESKDSHKNCNKFSYGHFGNTVYYNTIYEM